MTGPYIVEGRYQDYKVRKDIQDELQILGRELHIKPHKFTWKENIRPVDVCLSFFTEVHKGQDFEDIKDMLTDFKTEVVFLNQKSE